MNYKSIFTGTLMVFSHLAFSQNWKVVSNSITFKIKHAFGATAEGNIGGFSGSIYFDTNQLTKTSMNASLEARTINTGLGLRDKTLKGSKYFEVEKFPKISINSTKIEHGANENEYIGSFDLAIKSTTKSIKTPFSFVKTTNSGQFKASFQINRLDFNIGESSALLGDIVTIFVTLNTVSL